MSCYVQDKLRSCIICYYKDMPSAQTATQEMPAKVISFKAKLFKINTTSILRLPEAVSAQLPARGQVMIEGTINGNPLKTPLEPDGKLSHYFIPSNKILAVVHAKSGDTVELKITSTKHWPEPIIPQDIEQALAKNPDARSLWDTITPLARWEWIRWIHSTGRAETRTKRIAVACSKLNSGMRRPCCWNRNLSTDPELSKNGVLLTPEENI
jgi:hypothetical protein